MAPTWESRVRQTVAGKVEAGAMSRARPGEFWGEVRAALTEAGLWQAGKVRAVVGPMWSAAIARRSAYEQFAKASPEQRFDISMAAPDINARELTVRNAQPEYLVRFDLTFTGPLGEQQTKTVSMSDVWRPGMTVGQVYDAVREAAEGLSNDYGQGMVGFGNLRPVLI